MSNLDVGMISAIVCVSYHLTEDAIRAITRKRQRAQRAKRQAATRTAS